MKIIKSLQILALTILTLTLIVSCSSSTGDNYLGTWETETDDLGNTIKLEIEKDGDVYKIHKTIVDSTGQIKQGKDYYDRTIYAPLTNNVIKVNPIDNIVYSEKENMLHWSKWHFNKVD